MSAAAVIALFGLLAVWLALERALPPQPGALAGGYGKWLALAAALLLAYLFWRSHDALNASF